MDKESEMHKGPCTKKEHCSFKELLEAHGSIELKGCGGKVATEGFYLTYFLLM